MMQRRLHSPGPAAVSPALVALAAFFWGLAGGIGGMLLADGWRPVVIAFYRGAIGLTIVLVWLTVRPRGSGLSSSRVWWWSVLAGVGVTGNFGFYFLSIAEGSVAVAATLMYCAPVFVYLVSFALGVERPTPTKGAAIAVVLLGIVMLTQVHDIDGAGVTVIGVVFGLLSGLSYAVFIFGFKYAARHGSPQAILTIAFATLLAVLLQPAGMGRLGAVIGTPSWPLFAALGVIGGGVSFILYIVGLHHTMPTVASIVAMVEPVTASLFGVVVLEERLSFVQTVGMALVLLTVTGLSVGAGGRGGGAR